jgi:hypothetical protein
MANNENLTGTQGLDKNPQNINKKGRPVSIKNQLKEILLKDGELPIPINQLVRQTETHYVFKLPTQEALALKLVNTAMSKGSNGFNALKLMLETFDGRATQTVDAKINQTPKIIFQHADGKVIGE